LAEDAASVEDLKKNINELFSNKADSRKIVLGSVHSVKGMERDIVFMLSKHFALTHKKK